MPVLRACCLGEFAGTFLLVFFGCGAVHAAVLTGAQIGPWQVAIVWGVAIMVAIYVTGGLSGAHINPAVTLALALWRGFPWARVLPYWASQLAGAMAAAGCLVLLFGTALEEREKTLQVTRGGAGSEMTAMCYGEYYPNPGRAEAAWKAAPTAATLGKFRQLVTENVAFFAEFLGTMILALVVFALPDLAGPGSRLAPVFIGLTVAILISVIAPLTQACFNPARDFGPRLVAAAAGWGEIALPGPNGRGFFTVYILAPLAGALAGGGSYERLIRPWFLQANSESAP